MMKRNRIAMLCISLLLASLLLVSCSGKSEDTLVVGGKTYTESILTAEIAAQLIEKHTDYKVERQYDLATSVVFEGVKSGEIDLFVEYTSVGLINYLKQEAIYDDPNEVYEIVKEGYAEQFDMVWLDTWGFNNTYANAVTSAFSKEHNVTSNSQLAPLTPDLIYGAEHGFFDREDGYDNMCKTYGFEFKDTAKMDVGLIYQAMSQGKMDVASVYTTDGMLQEADLVVLEDDLGYFPQYFAAVVINGESFRAHPELETALAGLKDCATDDDMSRYNYLVDSGKMSIEAAASEFIKEKGL